MPGDLFAYTITAHERRQRNTTRPIDSLHPIVGGDVLDIIDHVLVPGTEWPAPPTPGLADTRQTVHTVLSSVTDPTDSRVRYGRVRVTRSALRHDVERTQEQDIVEIHDDDREGRPLFFWLVAARGSSAVLLLTEHRARFGIVSSFWMDVIVKELRTRYSPDLTFNLTYYIEEPIWDAYLEHGTGLKGVILRRVLSDDAESTEQVQPSRRRTVGELTKITTHIDRSVSPARDRVAAALRDRSRRGAVELILGDTQAPGIDLENLDDYDSVQIDVELDGHIRRVAIGRDHAPQIGTPIEGVPFDQEGYHDVDALAEFAEETARRIGGPLGL